MSNISEGYERGSQKEFVLYLYYAKGSIGELRSQLYVAHDLGYVSEGEFKELVQRALSISRQLSRFIEYLKSRPK